MNLSIGVAMSIKTYHFTQDKWIYTFIMLSFLSQKQVISNSQASKPEVPGQKKTQDLLYFVTA